MNEIEKEFLKKVKEYNEGLAAIKKEFIENKLLNGLPYKSIQIEGNLFRVSGLTEEVIVKYLENKFGEKVEFKDVFIKGFPKNRGKLLRMADIKDKARIELSPAHEGKLCRTTWDIHFKVKGFEEFFKQLYKYTRENCITGELSKELSFFLYDFQTYIDEDYEEIEKMFMKTGKSDYLSIYIDILIFPYRVAELKEEGYKFAFSCFYICENGEKTDNCYPVIGFYERPTEEQINIALKNIGYEPERAFKRLVRKI